MNNLIPTQFQVQIIAPIQKISPVLSSSRVRIFYKGPNRNRTYITEEFAEKLISTLPYTPVSGIYDEQEQDFTDHGSSRQESKVYGIVPKDYNFAWEKHLDDDGVEREYACCDVYLFTARYREASQIVGKAQSMELYPPLIQGDWIQYDGKEYYRFSDGCFLGLQVLGDSVEPCFEGGAFYSTIFELRDTVAEIEKYVQQKRRDKNVELFRLSDNEKACILQDLINAYDSEKGEWANDSFIEAVYDDYALVYKCKSHQYYRQYYTKNEDSVELGDEVECYIMDVTAEEKQCLDNLHTNIGTYSDIEAKIDTLTSEATDKDTTINSLNETIAQNNEAITNCQAEINSLTEQVTTATQSLAEANDTIADYTTQINELTEYKTNVENKAKETLLDDFRDKLPNDVIQDYTAKIGEYSLVDFKKDLAVSAYEYGCFGAPEHHVPRPAPEMMSEAQLAVKNIIDNRNK